MPAGKAVWLLHWLAPSCVLQLLPLDKYQLQAHHSRQYRPQPHQAPLQYPHHSQPLLTMMALASAVRSQIHRLQQRQFLLRSLHHPPLLCLRIFLLLHLVMRRQQQIRRRHLARQRLPLGHLLNYEY